MATNVKFYRGTDTNAHKTTAGSEGILFATDTKAIYHNSVKYGQNYDSSISSLNNKINNIVYIASSLPSTTYNTSIYLITQ